MDGARSDQPLGRSGSSLSSRSGKKGSGAWGFLPCFFLLANGALITRYADAYSGRGFWSSSPSGGSALPSSRHHDTVSLIRSPMPRVRSPFEVATYLRYGGCMREKRKKRGGGPKTAEGKAAVRLNPIKHGVLAQTPVIPLVEREEDWQRLRDGVFAYLDVEGTLEEALADRIAGLIWRLYRVVRFESESISRYLHEVPRDWGTSRRMSGQEIPPETTPEMVDEMDGMLMARLLPGQETLEKVMRYETRLHRFLLQSVHQLLLLKGTRKAMAGRYYGIADLDPPGLSGRRGAPRLPAG